MSTYKRPLLALAVTVSFVTYAAGEDSGDNKNIFDKLSGAGFRLSQASSGPDRGEPAKFGFLTDVGNETDYHANFFLSYNPLSSISWGGTEVSPLLFSVEGKLSSLNTSAKDAWRFRLGSQFDVGGGSPNSLWLSLDAKYETDRYVKTKKIAGQLQMSPTVPDLALGKKWPVQGAKDPQPIPVQFRWRPILEVDLGHTDDPGASSEVDDTLLRLIPRVRADLYLNFLKRPLGVQQVSIYADNTFFYLPIENQTTTHNYVVTGIDFMINSNVGLTFEYQYGEDSPNFVQTHTVGGAVSIGF